MSDCLFRRLRAGVIVNDPPAFRKALPHQRKHSANFTLLPFQMPAPQHQRVIRAQKTKFQIGKIELAHRRAIRIILFIARQHTIPSARDTATPRKRQLRRMPVAHQKCVRIASIPSVLLRSKNGNNGASIRLAFLRFISAKSSPPRPPRCKQAPFRSPASQRNSVQRYDIRITFGIVCPGSIVETVP